MFNLKDFVVKTIKNMIGNVPDYKVQEYALSWYNRGTIGDTELSEIDNAISEHNIAVNEPIEMVEETTDKITYETVEE